MQDVITANNISKVYKMYSSNREKIIDMVFGKSNAKNFYALKGISFSIEKGDCVGLIGLNGSGKSTLANIIGGVIPPTSGQIEVSGEVAITALSGGLNGQLTGIENIEMKGLLLGLTRKKIEELKESIIEFADIGEFIYQPVKLYSSGMKSRLGFSISVNVNPDILIIDEALSVGDSTFTQKCLNKIEDYRKNGKTIIFVSHSTSSIKQFCNKVIWLEYGVMREYGSVNEVVPMYSSFLKNYNAMTKEEIRNYRKERIDNQSHLLLQETKGK